MSSVVLLINLWYSTYYNRCAEQTLKRALEIKEEESPMDMKELEFDLDSWMEEGDGRQFKAEGWLKPECVRWYLFRVRSNWEYSRVVFWVSLAPAAPFGHEVISPRLHQMKKLILEAAWSLDRGGQLCDYVLSACVSIVCWRGIQSKHATIADGEREETQDHRLIKVTKQMEGAKWTGETSGKWSSFHPVNQKQTGPLERSQ